MNTLTAVAQSMSASENERFLGNFVAANPMWKGANVDDILDHMNNSDAHVGLVEYYIDEHPSVDPTLTATVVRACIVINGGERNVTATDISNMLTRVRKG